MNTVPDLYAECHYAEYRYAECCGTKLNLVCYLSTFEEVSDHNDDPGVLLPDHSPESSKGALGSRLLECLSLVSDDESETEIERQRYGMREGKTERK